jgi:hypothetical protein
MARNAQLRDPIGNYQWYHLSILDGQHAMKVARICSKVEVLSNSKVEVQSRPKSSPAPLENLDHDSIDTYTVRLEQNMR